MIRTRKAYISVFEYPPDWDPLRFPSVLSEKLRAELQKDGVSEKLRQSAAAELAYRAARMAAWKDASSSFGAGPFMPDPNEWTRQDYIKNTKGKPELREGFVSITHTGGLSGAAFSFAPVGIDAEQRRSVSEKLVRRTLCAKEYSEYEAAGDKQAFFLESWTAKESLLKLTGEGLGGSMAAVRYDRESRTAGGAGIPEDYMIGQISTESSEAPVYLSVCCPKGTDPSFMFFSDPIELLIYINAIR